MQEGISPAAPLAPVDLSQSNVEGNQLKHHSDSPRAALTEDLVLSGRQLETVQCRHGPDVVYAVLDNSGLMPSQSSFPVPEQVLR